MRVAELLKKAWSADLLRSKQVRVTAFKRVKSKGAVKLVTVTRDMVDRAKSGTVKPRIHRQMVYPQRPWKSGKPGKIIDLTKVPLVEQEVRVSCDCERFLFFFEYALAKRKAAHIRFGNGEPPTITNPSQKIGLCKHLIVVLREIIKRQL